MKEIGLQLILTETRRSNMATFSARRLARRAPKVFDETDGSVSPLRGQHSKLLQIKPFDPEYNRLMKEALKPLQTRRGQK